MTRLRPDPGTDALEDAADRPRPVGADATTGASVMAGGMWQVASSLAPRLQILVMSVVAARALGPGDMGRQSFIAFVMLSVVEVASGGVSLTLSRFVARSVGERRSDLVALLYRRSRRIGIVVAVAAALLVLWIGAARDELPAAWAWAAVGTAVVIAHSVPAQLLGGLQRWRDLSRVTLSIGLVTTVTLVTVLALGGGITEMFLIGAVSGFASLVWTRAIAGRSLPAVEAGDLPVGMRRDMRAYAGVMVVQVALTLVVWQRSEFWFLDRYASDQEIALYSIAFSAVMSLGRVPFALANVAFPAFATLDGARQSVRLRRAVTRILRLQILGALPMTAFMIAAGPALVAVFYGSEYEATGPVLRVLMAGFPLLPLGLSGGAFLMGLGRMRSLIVIYAIGGMVNVSLDLLLIPQHAALGAAWASTAAQAVICVALGLAIHRLIGGLDLDVRHLWRGSAVAGVATLLGLAAADHAGTPLVALVASGAVVVAVSWLGGGVARVVPRADVDWLAAAAGSRLGPRASAVVRWSLAPLG